MTVSKLVIAASSPIIGVGSSPDVVFAISEGPFSSLRPRIQRGCPRGRATNSQRPRKQSDAADRDQGPAGDRCRDVEQMGREIPAKPTALNEGISSTASSCVPASAEPAREQEQGKP